MQIQRAVIQCFYYHAFVQPSQVSEWPFTLDKCRAGGTGVARVATATPIFWGSFIAATTAATPIFWGYVCCGHPKVTDRVPALQIIMTFCSTLIPKNKNVLKIVVSLESRKYVSKNDSTSYSYTILHLKIYWFGNAYYNRFKVVFNSDFCLLLSKYIR